MLTAEMLLWLVDEQVPAGREFAGFAGIVSSLFLMPKHYRVAAALPRTFGAVLRNNRLALAQIQV